MIENMTTDNVLKPPGKPPSFRRRLSISSKSVLSQTWMNERFAGLKASDFRQNGLVVASTKDLDAPDGFGDAWKTIEQINFEGVASLLLFLDLQDDAEMSKLARVLKDADVSSRRESLRIVVAHHSIGLTKKVAVKIDRNQFAQLVDRDIAVISTEPIGLELALVVRSKFLTVRSQCKHLSQKRLDREAQFLRNTLQETVWTYLRERLHTGIPAESPSIAAGVPTYLGDATLGKMLGEGTWGKVFAMTSPDSGVSVVKCMAKSQFTSLRGIKGLKNEISMMQRLSSNMLAHPNIIRLYNVYSSCSHVFLQMEHGGFETLASRIKRRDIGACNASVTLHDALSMISQCVDALDHLHRKANVAHRDLKTENIIFSETESGYQIKVADFGLASVCGSGTVCYSRCGTFVFLAPEEVLEDSYNACIADVWSMGIIFLEILCFLRFPDTVLFRRRRYLSETQIMQEVRTRLGTSEEIYSLIQTYLRPEYRVKGIVKEIALCGMLNTVPSGRSKASDVSFSCAACLAQVCKSTVGFLAP